MKELKSLNLTIFNKNYSISTDENEDIIFQAAKKVDFLMNELSNKTSLKDDTKIAVLVALQLANDLEKNRKRLNSWEEKTERLNNLLNS